MGTNIFTHKRGGGTNNFQTQGGTNIFTLRVLGRTFHDKYVVANDDVDLEKGDVSIANILVNEARKLAAGARIFRGP